jgi:GNAT superfamily N-acetyltransferase
MKTHDDQLEIRSAGPEDAALIAPLLAQLGYSWEPAAIAARFGGLTSVGDTALLALRGGTAIGLATLHATPVLHRAASVGRVTSLIVSDSARGQGVGRALMVEAERILTARGCGLIEVTSNRTRTDAHAFYEKLGYVATSFRFAKTIERK